MRGTHATGFVQRSLGIGGHHRGYRGGTNDWLTPPELIEALGPFDTDPATPLDGMPWPTATTMLTPDDDGLTADWDGLVWLNPPYGPDIGEWMHRLAHHEPGGVALVFARTETRWFQEQVFAKATSILFLDGRLNFHHLDGTRADKNSGAPSVLVAYGPVAAARVAGSGIAGRVIAL